MLRKSYSDFLQEMGRRLVLPQMTIATALVFCHRFFLRQSHAKNDWEIVAIACIFLAGKVESTINWLQDVIMVGRGVKLGVDEKTLHREKLCTKEYEDLILLAEKLVLVTIDFEIDVAHPYRPLSVAIDKLDVSIESKSLLTQVAYHLVNDGLRSWLCLQFKPHQIAAGVMFLAARGLEMKLNPSDWWCWPELDVNEEQLKEMSDHLLELDKQSSTPRFNHNLECETISTNGLRVDDKN
uniref:B-like cyclin n=2 Tax=Cajanus cajan TaxID=3821 RepID=A0A151UC93_CAJCA|nr:Cyclin-T1-3 [Cajanus cajan]